MNNNSGHHSIVDKLARRKMEVAGQVLRESSEDLHNTILEGYVVGRRDRGRERRTDELKDLGR